MSAHTVYIYILDNLRICWIFLWHVTWAVPPLHSEVMAPMLPGMIPYSPARALVAPLRVTQSFFSSSWMVVFCIGGMTIRCSFLTIRQDSQQIKFSKKQLNIFSHDQSSFVLLILRNWWQTFGGEFQTMHTCSFRTVLDLTRLGIKEVACLTPKVHKIREPSQKIHEHCLPNATTPKDVGQNEFPPKWIQTEL